MAKRPFIRFMPAYGALIAALGGGCSIYDPPEGPVDAGDETEAGDGSPRDGTTDLDAADEATDAAPDTESPDLDAATDASDSGDEGPIEDAMPEAGDAAADGDAAVGCAGYALTFGGATSTSFNRPVQDDFTLEAWIKTKTSLTGTNWWDGAALVYADNVANNNDFGTSILGDKFCFGVGNPNTTLLSKSKVTTDQWVHVAATRIKATGELRVIVNGVSEASVVVNQKAPLDSQALVTLGANGLNGHYFVGLIDEVRLWNVVRTPAAIKADMNHRLAGNEPGLVSYFRLDDMGARIASDSSPMKNDALLTGPAVWAVSDAPICP
jgi:Concanavalin A-like lectin/glucanases superfamily